MSLLNKTTREAPAAKPEKAPKAPKAQKPPKTPKAAREPKAPRPPKEAKLDRRKAEAQAAPQWRSAYKPGIVLLPSKERKASVMRKSLRNASLVSAGMLTLTVAGYIAVSMSLSGAQSSLNTHNELRSQNAAALTAALPVSNYVSGIDFRKEAAVAALQGDTAFSKVIAEIDAANTVGARITSVTIGDASETLSGKPFGGAEAVGYLRIGGYIDVDSTPEGIRLAGSFADDLSKRGGVLTDAYATTAMEDDGAVRFTITVGYTEEAYTFRGLEYAPQETEPAPAEEPATATTEETTQ